MRCKNPVLLLPNLLLTLALLTLPQTHTATVQDIFNLSTQPSLRLPRDSNKYYSPRYGSSSSNSSPLSRNALKPEDSPEARENTPAAPVEKRCTRCDPYYDSRTSPYDSRPRYDDRRYRDRYDFDDRRYDRYDDRERYDRYDRRPSYYDRERPDRYYDRERYDRYDRYPDYDRGFGYDNRGYDYKERYDRDGYRPWDETYRGTSGFDNSGRGYYFATGRPEVGAGYWGTGGYASNWNYGGGGGRDDYRDRYGGGYGGRPRDPYDGYRSTSYLYGRPSSTTTDHPDNADNAGVTQPQASPQENSSG